MIYHDLPFTSVIFAGREYIPQFHLSSFSYSRMAIIIYILALSPEEDSSERPLENHLIPEVSPAISSLSPQNVHT